MADALVNKINKSKTTIFFSKSTIEEMREHIKLALGVTEVKQYEKYLVLPLRGQKEEGQFQLYQRKGVEEITRLGRKAMTSSREGDPN